MVIWKIKISKHQVLEYTLPLTQVLTHPIVQACVPLFTTNVLFTYVCLESRIVALRLFDGIIKIINLNSSNKQLTATTQRIDEIEVLDMQFLYVISKPTLALLYQDQSVSMLSYRISKRNLQQIREGTCQPIQYQQMKAMMLVVVLAANQMSRQKLAFSYPSQIRPGFLSLDKILSHSMTGKTILLYHQKYYKSISLFVPPKLTKIGRFLQ